MLKLTLAAAVATTLATAAISTANAAPLAGIALPSTLETPPGATRTGHPAIEKVTYVRYGYGRRYYGRPYYGRSFFFGRSYGRRYY
jgi:hypothetical protein